MKIQALIVFMFACNLTFIWQFSKNKICKMIGQALFIILPFLGVFFSQPKFELDHSWWVVAGYVAIILGLGIWGWAIKSFKPGLNTKDAYYYVRHPQYLGLMFIWVGWWWIWAGVYSFYFGMLVLGLVWLQAYLEERSVLEKEFGQKYLEYKKYTGMFWVK